MAEFGCGNMYRCRPATVAGCNYEQGREHLLEKSTIVHRRRKSLKKRKELVNKKKGKGERGGSGMKN